MADPSDDLHETRLRAEIGSPAADNPAWTQGHFYHAGDVAFLLRRILEARAETDRLRAQHDARVTELLEANTREVERRRAVEAEIQRLLSRLRDWGARLERLSEIETVLEASG